MGRDVAVIAFSFRRRDNAELSRAARPIVARVRCTAAKRTLRRSVTAMAPGAHGRAATGGYTTELCVEAGAPVGPRARWRSIMTHPCACVAAAQALVDSIAIKAGVSKKTAGLVLGASELARGPTVGCPLLALGHDMIVCAHARAHAALDVIVDSVSEGHKVSLIGFGTFTAKQRPQREARNPKTGEKMIVPAATVPSFSFGKARRHTAHHAARAVVTSPLCSRARATELQGRC
jgi:nucleoid DNA-binding protein